VIDPSLKTREAINPFSNNRFKFSVAELLSERVEEFFYSLTPQLNDYPLKT
jgi:hypothetical protein